MTLNSIVAQNADDIRKKRNAQAIKKAQDEYDKTLNKLALNIQSVNNTLDCIDQIEAQRIATAPIVDSVTKNDLLSCIDDCGQGLSEGTLESATVDVFSIRQEALKKHLEDSWHSIAERYAAGLPGFLKTVGAISADPALAEKLSQDIIVLVEGKPSKKAINELVASTQRGKTIAEGYSLTAEVRSFLDKVKAGGAKLSDLTPEIQQWIRIHQLEGKFRIRF